MKTECDTVTLSSGRQFYAYGCILGIDEDLTIYNGYDGFLREDLDDDKPLTADERREIADHMIELWTKWRDTNPEQQCGFSSDSPHAT